jgi:hypothetical protein
LAVGISGFTLSVVSHDERRGADPNATIQVDPANVLDQIQLVDSAPPGASRKTPPPLPPSSSAPSPASAPATRGTSGKTVAYVGLFVALIAVAVAAGLVVGRRAGATRPSPAAGSASPSGSVLTIPPVEIR